MQLRKRDYHLIKRFIRDQLSEKETFEFESRMLNDAFKNALDLEKEIYLVAQHQGDLELKNLLVNKERELRSRVAEDQIDMSPKENSDDCDSC